LEKEAAVANEQKEKLESEVCALESSIANYKAEYATLIRDVEALKREMEIVITKVSRAESLMKSLSQESSRWSKSSEGFQAILRNLVGDGLQMAAFLTYSGFFTFTTRRLLLQQWRNTLDLLGIEFREDLSMLESLSKASDRLIWQSQGLPSDSLSLENGVILDCCVRFPLIIDPSGHAIDVRIVFAIQFVFLFPRNIHTAINFLSLITRTVCHEQVSRRKDSKDFFP
jgi:dynein heavy chain 1